jgi:hypothetical protein
MYVDDEYGRTWHIGYVVGKHWCTTYSQVREAV